MHILHVCVLEKVNANHMHDIDECVDFILKWHSIVMK